MRSQRSHFRLTRARGVDPAVPSLRALRVVVPPLLSSTLFGARRRARDTRFIRQPRAGAALELEIARTMELLVLVDGASRGHARSKAKHTLARSVQCRGIFHTSGCAMAGSPSCQLWKTWRTPRVPYKRSGSRKLGEVGSASTRKWKAHFIQWSATTVRLVPSSRGCKRTRPR